MRAPERSNSRTAGSRTSWTGSASPAGRSYHYFDSKEAILGALVDQMGSDAADALLPIVRDPKSTALEKFRSYVETHAGRLAVQRRLGRGGATARRELMDAYTDSIERILGAQPGSLRNDRVDQLLTLSLRARAKELARGGAR